eukprot:gene9299-1567_t
MQDESEEIKLQVRETRSYSTPGTCCVSPESSRDVEETPGSQRNTAHSCGRSRKLERNLSSKSCPYSVYDNRILSQVTSPCTPQYKSHYRTYCDLRGSPSPSDSPFSRTFARNFDNSLSCSSLVAPPPRCTTPCKSPLDRVRSTSFRRVVAFPTPDQSVIREHRSYSLTSECAAASASSSDNSQYISHFEPDDTLSDDCVFLTAVDDREDACYAFSELSRTCRTEATGRSLSRDCSYSNPLRAFTSSTEDHVIRGVDLIRGESLDSCSLSSAVQSDFRRKSLPERDGFPESNSGRRDTSSLVLVVDNQGVIQIPDNRVAALFKCNTTYLLGHNIGEFLHHPDVKQGASNMWPSYAFETPSYGRIMMGTGKDGSSIVAAVSIKHVGFESSSKESDTPDQNYEICSPTAHQQSDRFLVLIEPVLCSSSNCAIDLNSCTIVWFDEVFAALHGLYGNLDDSSENIHLLSVFPTISCDTLRASVSDNSVLHVCSVVPEDSSNVFPCELFVTQLQDPGCLASYQTSKQTGLRPFVDSTSVVMLQHRVYAYISGILTLNQDGKIVYASETLTRVLFGRCKEEILGKSIGFLVPDLLLEENCHGAPATTSFAQKLLETEMPNIAEPTATRLPRFKLEGSDKAYGVYADGTKLPVTYVIKKAKDPSISDPLYCIWLTRVSLEEKIRSALSTEKEKKYTPLVHEQHTPPLYDRHDDDKVSSLGSLQQTQMAVCGNFAREYRTVRILGRERVKDDKAPPGQIPREISILKMLHHTNLPFLEDFFHNSDFYQVVMTSHEPAYDLFQFIEENPLLEEAVASYIFRQLVSAVNYLHRMGILHRDIKDENILINFDLHIKLIDFGSACYIRNKNQPLFDTFCGTLTYCPPEVLQGNCYRGPELDIYAMGITLYILLFGEYPFFTAEEALQGHLYPPMFVSRQCLELLLGILHMDPQCRWKMDAIASHPWDVQDKVNLLCANQEWQQMKISAERHQLQPGPQDNAFD